MFCFFKTIAQSGGGRKREFVRGCIITKNFVRVSDGGERLRATSKIDGTRCFVWKRRDVLNRSAFESRGNSDLTGEREREAKRSGARNIVAPAPLFRSTNSIIITADAQITHSHTVRTNIHLYI